MKKISIKSVLLCELTNVIINVFKYMAIYRCFSSDETDRHEQKIHVLAFSLR